MMRMISFFEKTGGAGEGAKVGELIFDDGVSSSFWKKIADGSGKYRMNGTFLEGLTARQNRHYGNGLSVPCLRFQGKTPLCMKNVILPRQSVFSLTAYGKERMKAFRRQDGMEARMERVVRYTLHVLREAHQRDLWELTAGETYPFYFPREMISDEVAFWKLAGLIGMGRVREYEAGFMVELSWRAARRFTGFYMAYEMFAEENLRHWSEVKKRKDQEGAAGNF